MRSDIGLDRREHQVGIAEDRGHGRADLVAHVGQEVALGAAGFLGLFLGSRKLRRAGSHQFFQVMAVQGQLGVALLDLIEHGVEAIDEHASSSLETLAARIL